MQLEGSHTLQAPRAQVWAALNDPDVLARCVPGVRSLTRDGENTYKGALELAVGPVKGTYQGRVTLGDLVPPQSMSINLEAKAPVGVVRAKGNVTLEEQGDATVVRWVGTPQLAGMLATLGGRLIGGVAKQQAEVFFKKLEREAQTLQEV